MLFFAERRASVSKLQNLYDRRKFGLTGRYSPVARQAYEIYFECCDMLILIYHFFPKFDDGTNL